MELIDTGICSARLFPHLHDAVVLERSEGSDSPCLPRIQQQVSQWGLPDQISAEWVFAFAAGTIFFNEPLALVTVLLTKH
jgi:hypothetical protein